MYRADDSKISCIFSKRSRAVRRPVLHTRLLATAFLRAKIQARASPGVGSFPRSRVWYRSTREAEESLCLGTGISLFCPFPSCQGWRPACVLGCRQSVSFLTQGFEVLPASLVPTVVSLFRAFASWSLCSGDPRGAAPAAQLAQLPEEMLAYFSRTVHPCSTRFDFITRQTFLHTTELFCTYRFQHLCSHLCDFNKRGGRHRAGSSSLLTFVVSSAVPMGGNQMGSMV